MIKYTYLILFFVFLTNISFSQRNVLVKNTFVNVKEFGASYGTNLSETMQRKNWEAYQMAFNVAKANADVELHITDTLEVYHKCDQQTLLSLGQSLRITGGGVIKIFPLTDNCPDVSVNGTDFIEVRDSSSLEIDNITFIGQKYFNYKQHYSATLKPSGDSDRILITDTEKWVGFWSNIATGDTMYYYALPETIGFKGIINSIDSVAGTIDLTANLDGSISNDLVNFAAFNFPHKTPVDTILQYGEKWFVNGRTPRLIHIPGTLDSVHHKITIKNSSLVDASNPIRLNNGNTSTLEIINSTIHGIELGINFFVGDTMCYGGLFIENSIIKNCGFLSIGSQGETTTDDIWGSGIYMHPNVPLIVGNSTFENNLAQALRYSSTGSKPSWEKAKTLLYNNRFYGGTEPDFRGSSSLEADIISCDFHSLSGVDVSKSTNLLNCNFYGGVFSSGNTYPVSTDTAYINFENCVFHDLSSINFNSPRTKFISFNSCDFHIGEEVDPKLAIGDNTSSPKYTYTNISNCKILDKGFDQKFIYQYGTENKLRISNLQTFGFINEAFIRESHTDGIPWNDVLIENSEIYFNRVYENNLQKTGYARLRNVAFDVSNFVIEESEGFIIESLIDEHAFESITNVTLSSSSSFNPSTQTNDVLLIDDFKRNITFSGSKLRAIHLYTLVGGNHRSFTHNFQGELILTPLDTVTIYPFNVTNDSMGNILMQDTLIIPAYHTFKMKCQPGVGLGDSIVITNGTVLDTGDGIETIFSTTNGNNFKTESYIMGTVSITAGSVILVETGFGVLEGNGGKGWINYHTGGYRLEFDSPVASGTDITISRREVASPEQAGYWTIIK